MKSKTLFFTVLFAAALSFCLFADDNKFIFTEYSVSYASMIAPSVLENNTTGVYDTAAFGVKAGAAILKWVDIYAGGDFMFFQMRPDSYSNYTFYPIYGGIRANICPDFSFYPGTFFELGKALSSHHATVTQADQALGGLIYSPVDYAWSGTYYNFGFDLNMRVNDIGIFSVKLDRPAISSGGTNLGEIHVIRVGVAWKVLY